MSNEVEEAEFDYLLAAQEALAARKDEKKRRCYFALMVIISVAVIVTLAAVIPTALKSTSHRSDFSRLHAIHSESIEVNAAFYETPPFADGKEVTDWMFQELKAYNIRENLRKLTENPHLGGTSANHDLAQDLKNLWTSQGMDNVKLVPYHVLMSYPDIEKPNRIEIQDQNGKKQYATATTEKTLTPFENQPNVIPPYNAWSAAGSPQGDLVYVNYGRIEDFEWITEEKGINITDKIVIVRYNKIFRGNKALNAQKYGAAGLIIYSDPADYAPEGSDNVYPTSWWLPETGVQRGSLSLMGDPQTQGYPSIKSAYRSEEFPEEFPTIPVQPISYGDAIHFLRNLGGDHVPMGWRGGLNITYRLGPGFSQNDDNFSKVQMFVNTHTEPTVTYDVIGFITGSEEPDRYVLLGNHRDAWVYGGIDPSSGTATMMEIARVFTEMVQNGWRPRRTLVFCSWGSEEMALIGSREWVENYRSLLSERAVAYINVDCVLGGTVSFAPKGMPLLYKQIYEVAKLVPNPLESEIAAGRYSVYDTWLAIRPEVDPEGIPTGRPSIENPGSGSDFEPFVSHVGVTVIDLTFDKDPALDLGAYPLYHSVHDTFEMVDNFMDPGFKHHLALAKIWIELLRRLAFETLIPFDVSGYPGALYNDVQRVDIQYGDLMRRNGVGSHLDYLYKALAKFSRAAQNFQERLDHGFIDITNDMVVRQLNDQMVQLERAFVDPIGLPNRPLVRHVVYGPSKYDSYSGSLFPGLSDSLFNIEKVPKHSQEGHSRWEQVKHEVARLSFTLEVAAATISPVTDF